MHPKIGTERQISACVAVMPMCNQTNLKLWLSARAPPQSPEVLWMLYQSALGLNRHQFLAATALKSKNVINIQGTK